MLKIGYLNDNHVLTITAAGMVTRDDYNDALPALEEMLNQHDKLRFFIKLDDCSGFKPGALWEDLKFDFKHKSQFGKTAVVGDKKWEEWGIKLSRPFFEDEIRFYPVEQSDEAWEWVNH